MSWSRNPMFEKTKGVELATKQAELHTAHRCALPFNTPHLACTSSSTELALPTLWPSPWLFIWQKGLHTNSPAFVEGVDVRSQ